MRSRNGGVVAVVDDEEHIRETVAYALQRDGYRVVAYADGQEAWEGLHHSRPDVVVLDILMPRMDGLELCRRLRGVSETLPILFLSSRDEELDRVLGLELGADDYLCKPFSMRELTARVKVLFRRLALAGAPPASSESQVHAGSLALDLDRYRARWEDLEVPLTVTEFRILHALVRHPGHVKTRDQLVNEGYPNDSYVSDRTIDTHIKRLRRKILEIAPGFDRIETVYGLGYRYRDE